MSHDFFRNRGSMGALPQLPKITPFFPTSVAGCVLWLKADSLALNNGDAVASWPDSSGNNNNASQGTSANRPTFYTNIQNGLPAVRATGSHWVTTPSMTIRTVFVVARHETYTELNGVFCESGLDKENLRLGGTTTYIVSEDANGFYGSGGSLRVNKVATFNQTMNVFSILTAVRASARAFVLDFLRGAQSANRHMRGYIAEVLVYNTVLSDTDRNNIENYLASKYGL